MIACLHRTLLRFAFLLCTVSPLVQAYAANEPSVPYAFVVAGDGQYTVRALTPAATCPAISWDGQTPVQMAVRVEPEEIASRFNGDGKAASFPVLSCEARWVAGVKQAKVGNQILATPKAVPRRIVVLGDTGCRLKAADDAFQDCLNDAQWPLARIAKQAADKQPDLVIHVGDITYRESPCPDAIAGCSGSVWGHGYDVWDADFFTPAAPLLAKAPWVFVRGNHEMCERGGQGWFRFLDSHPFNAAQACNTEGDFEASNHTQPFAVSLGSDAQLIVFDSSADKKKLSNFTKATFETLSKQFDRVDDATKAKHNSIFLSHHPLDVLTKDRDTGRLVVNQSGLGQLVASRETDFSLRRRLNFSVHGHFHAFEAIAFTDDRQPVIITGNGGSALEQSFASQQVTKTVLKENRVKSFTGIPGFGFMTLDRRDELGSSWLLTEYDMNGKALATCKLRHHRSKCHTL